MSPPRKGKGGRADIDALRARVAEVESARRTSKHGDVGRKVGGKNVRTKGLAEEPFDDPFDDPFEDPGDPFDDPFVQPAGAGPSGRWWEQEEAGRPRPVVGGIPARTRKGPIGATWWSRRFLESLESLMVGGRVDRGRSYARKGQVVDLHVGPGVVAATVQGSRDAPYAVHLRLPVVAREDWDRIVAALAARAGYAARMLAGDLPQEVEEVFESEGESLLPTPHARLVSECTCPDWENPCKHVAAVCYLLAEEFDRDPFSLLAWRGRGREEVLAQLRARRRTHAGDTAATSAGTRAPAAAAAPAPEGDVDARDARDALASFWEAGPELAHVRIHPAEAQVPAAALRLAPRGTITVRGGDLVDVLAPAYRAIVAAAAARARR